MLLQLMLIYVHIPLTLGQLKADRQRCRALSTLQLKAQCTSSRAGICNSSTLLRFRKGAGSGEQFVDGCFRAPSRRHTAVAPYASVKPWTRYRHSELRLGPITQAMIPRAVTSSSVAASFCGARTIGILQNLGEPCGKGAAISVAAFHRKSKRF